jgi:hypothetical protein
VAVRRASWPLRRPPEILVVGTQRGGTSSLFRFLAAHPDVRRPVRKEIEFFAADHHRGPTWYRAHFPIRGRGRSSMDCTPQYLFHPHAPARAAELLPDARIVVLLRDPVARAHSHWRHMTTLGHETLTFAEAVAAEPERTDQLWQRMVAEPGFHAREVMRFSYVRRGLYAEQLARWQQHFAHDQILIIDSDRLFSDPVASLSEVEGHLGLRRAHQQTLPNASGQHRVEDAPLTEDLTEDLRRRFAASDAELARQGFPAPWR